MKKKCNEGRKNVKGDCLHCPDHGICLAETNTPQYYCTKLNESQKSNSHEQR